MNQNRAYKLDVDLSGYIYISLPILCTFVVLWLTHPKWFVEVEAWIGVLPIVIAYIVLIILVVVFSYVEIRKNYIIVVFIGITICKIPVQSVTTVTYTEYGFGYMALTKKKLKIEYGKNRKILVSVKKANEFIKELGI